MSLTVQVEDYNIPEGYWDFPYVYTFDASSLTDGNTYTDQLNVIFDGDSDFILRHICGINNCVDTFANNGKWDLRNASRTYATGRPGELIAPCTHWVVLPEKLYPYNGAIWFDLQTVLRAFRTAGNYTSQLAFFGSKRFRNPSWMGDTRYNYRILPYILPYTLTLDWAAGTPVQSFYVPVQQYDFLLTEIKINKQATGTGLATDDFQIQLYDAWNHPLSRVPINQSYINSARLGAQTPPVYQPYFPTPALLYPNGSQIKFVANLLMTAVPVVYNIQFIGIWRIPA